MIIFLVLQWGKSGLLCILACNKPHRKMSVEVFILSLLLARCSILRALVVGTSEELSVHKKSVTYISFYLVYVKKRSATATSKDTRWDMFVWNMQKIMYNTRLKGLSGSVSQYICNTAKEARQLQARARDEKCLS